MRSISEITSTHRKLCNGNLESILEGGVKTGFPFCYILRQSRNVVSGETFGPTLESQNGSEQTEEVVHPHYIGWPELIRL